MTTPGERLKLIRGNMSQEEFAKLLGVSLRTYNGYENDEALPKISVLQQLESILGVSSDYILFGRQVTMDFSFIPYYTQPASAGQGALIEDQQIGKFLAFRTDWLRNELGAHVKDLFVMRVSGDSMESPAGEHGRRQLRSGDLILVDRGFTKLVPNQIYVVSLGEDLYVKAYRHNIAPDVIEFYAFNPAYTPLHRIYTAASPRQCDRGVTRIPGQETPPGRMASLMDGA